MLLYHNKGMPDADILGRILNVGDKVVIFNEHFISWDNCEIIEGIYNEDEPKRRGIKVDDGMKIFGLGTHEILKISKEDEN